MTVENDMPRPMIPKDVLKKIKTIHIRTNHLVNDIFAGEYESAFRGRGMEFEEVREYTPGDDIRDIDWNVTARFGHPFIKVYHEERELTIMLLVDVSSSCFFGTCSRFKQELAAELAAVLAFAATKNNDKVGLIIFSDHVEKYIPPKKGKTHVWRVIKNVLDHQPLSTQTDIGGALGYLNKVARRRCVAFLISDFIAHNYDRALRITARMHDLIAVWVMDPRELELPSAGIVEVRDAERGHAMVIDTANATVRAAYAQIARQTHQERFDRFKAAGIDVIEIRTDRPYIDPIMKFFRMRERRM
ncbi:MAG: DUF58 domain-containing protein [Desulfobacterota bacterium]|nr:DUF58 domain-containing protein [Thermodesulfobacteriota bacterium]